MHIQGKATNPDEIEFTISITASLKEWSELRAQLKSEWPSSDLIRAIFDIMLQVAKRFEPEDAA